MHLLIIPSEEYVPNHKPTASIFQHDQAKLLLTEGVKVGALSLAFPYSFLLLVKALFGFKIKKLNNFSRFKIMGMLFNLIFFRKKKSISVIQNDGVNVLRVNGAFMFRKSDFEKNYLKTLKYYGDYAISKYIRLYGKPDIIHAHNIFYAGILSDYLSKKYNIPILLTERSSEHIMTEISDFKRRIAIKGFKNIKNINAVSPSLVEQITKLYDIPEGKVRWVPNVIPSDFEEAELRSSNNCSFVFLNVANLIELKGHEDLIRAFNKVINKMPNAELRIIGGGKLKNQLNDLIKKFGLEERVKLLGYQSREIILEQMHQCDVFVFPSHYETFGVVLLEATAMGKVVVASSCGGPECIVNDINGIQFPPKEIQKLASALLKVYKNKGKYNAEDIKLDSITRFGRSQFLKKTLRTYKEIINDYHN